MSGSSAKIVICGAGIAGIAAAYYLAVEHGLENVMIVEQGNPLSLTSDKSTEAYRNWWPGPDRAMTAFMNRSIDLIEGIARATDNRINLNRRGYVFATADAGKIPFLRDDGEDGRDARRRPGAISRHARRAPIRRRPSAASISADRRGRHHRREPDPPALSLSRARDRGGGACAARRLAQRPAARHGDAGGGPRARREARCEAGSSASTRPADGCARSQVERDGERRALEATHVVLAGGPMQKRDGAADRRRSADHGRAPPQGQLPRHAGRHAAHGADADLARRAASALERRRARRARRGRGGALAAAEFPAGVHGRPDGAHRRRSSSSTITAMRSTRSSRCPSRAHYAEIALRGMSTMVPALKAYNGKAARPYVDGGYYMQDAREPAADRPAAGRGRLHFVRVFRLRRDGVVRRRRTHRAAHHGRRAARLRAGLPAVPLSGRRILRLAGALGRRRAALTTAPCGGSALVRPARHCPMVAPRGTTMSATSVPEFPVARARSRRAAGRLRAAGRGRDRPRSLRQADQGRRAPT